MSWRESKTEKWWILRATTSESIRYSRPRTRTTTGSIGWSGSAAAIGRRAGRFIASSKFYEWRRFQLASRLLDHGAELSPLGRRACGSSRKTIPWRIDVKSCLLLRELRALVAHSETSAPAEGREKFASTSCRGPR